MSKTILITGASSGIGKETAKYFQSKGWNVVATMRNPEKEEELTKLVNVLVTKLDVLDLGSIEKAVKKSIEKFGKVDVLVNNAGYGTFGPLEAFPRENILKQFNTNVIGLLDVTKALLPHFRANKSGVIINISSVGGKITFPLLSLYHGTKFAVEGITEALSFEMEQIGVRMKIVEPGAIATDFAGRSMDMKIDENQKEYLKTIEAFQKASANWATQASPAAVVAEVIYKAATDESGQLRFRAGQDAEMLLTNRSIADDATFMGGIKKQFGL